MALSDITNTESIAESIINTDAVRKIMGKRWSKYKRIAEMTVGIDDAVDKMLRAGMKMEEIAQILDISQKELSK